MSFFDVNCSVGLTGRLYSDRFSRMPELLRTMDQHSIDEALVFHTSALNVAPAEGNKAVLEMLHKEPRLHPCWVVMPGHTGEIAESDLLVEQMMGHRIKAARIFPRRIGPLRSYVFGKLLRALAQRRVVTLVDFELEHWSQHMVRIDWDGLYWALAEYAELPMVLLRAGHAVDRVLLPLAERFDNLYVETSHYVGTGSLERLSRRIGAERLLFGTGMPQYAPGPAITLVTYSGLSPKEKELIGGSNLHRLLNAVGIS